MRGRSLDRHDAIAYYRRFYTPSNAILIVAGDIDAETVKALANAAKALRAAVAKIVFYDFDKDDIREDQKASLDAKIPVLQANPSLKIRIGTLFVAGVFVNLSRHPRKRRRKLPSRWRPAARTPTTLDRGEAIRPPSACLPLNHDRRAELRESRFL